MCSVPSERANYSNEDISKRLFALSALLVVLLWSSAIPRNAAGQSTPSVDDKYRDSGSMGSTYVPIESWVYPAFERLEAFGYVQSAFAGQRPWTRMECARLLEETADLDTNDVLEGEPARIYASLAKEFSEELRRQDGAPNVGAHVDSLYLRSTAIAGTPVTDGYHFAQTLVNDYGRPYGPGNNLYSGISLRAVEGPFSFFIRAEGQRAGLEPGPLPSTLGAIAIADGNAFLVNGNTNGAAAGPVSGLARLRLLDAYGAITYKNNQISFGQQSLWWGPGKAGPVLFSNNAEPVLMLRFDRTAPFVLPSFGGILGPIRVQFFIGRLSGQQFISVPDPTSPSLERVVGQPGVAFSDQPFIHGEKVSFKPTPNFEFSVSRTVIFAGQGSPFTFRALARSYFSLATTGSDPGDRRVAFDLKYRVPGLRDWLTFYFDTFTDDEAFPLAYPKECVWNPGLFLARIPRLPKMDLRVEGLLSPPRYIAPGYYYFNYHYRSGYTNNRQLLGSWIGREAHGAQVWTNWWFTPRTSLELSYRDMTVSRAFLGGGNLHDFSAKAEYDVRPEWSIHLTGQYERTGFPLYAAAPSSNLSFTTELVYVPAKALRLWHR